MTNPTLISVPFASGGNKNTIQTTRQAGQDAQDATWKDGFPSITMTPINAGGLPPKGLDFNGIFYALSDNVVHRLKGLSVQFSANYATAIGGYPIGSKLELNDGSAIVISTVANNMTDPNSSMTGWSYYSGSASIVNTLTSTDATRPLSAAQGKVLNDSKISTNFSQITASASGTSDAITASYTPAITALINGMSLFVRASAANTTATPTFTPNSGVIAAKTIVKGAGSALVAGNIAGAGHWLELQYDSTLDKWVLLNPYIPAASTTQEGTVQLNNTLTSTATDQALTAAQGKIIAGSFLNSLSAIGYQKLLGGLILQWGKHVGGGSYSSPRLHTFPIQFPNQCFSVVATTDSLLTSRHTCIGNLTTSNFSSVNSGSADDAFRWIAIGY